MTPIQVSSYMRAGLQTSPTGRIGVVSVPGSPSILAQFAKATATVLQSSIGGTINAGKYILNPQGLLGPGPVSKAVIRSANSVTSAVDKTTNSISAGVEKGFKYGTLILICVVGLWAWSVIRPPR